ncbi:hypothetical protein [Longispora albida]|uniref:hypothetical protein n=1 Tax=Longispora albida TaxID=203523 RepID=UPI00037DDEA9|nr:hypothetical protein [Longispora albida]
MAKQDAWESATDPVVAADAPKRRGAGRKLAVLAGIVAIAGAGLALTKGRKARKAKRR